MLTSMQTQHNQPEAKYVDNEPTLEIEIVPLLMANSVNWTARYMSEQLGHESAMHNARMHVRYALENNNTDALVYFARVLVILEQTQYA